jgi:biopolymer transport protein ExbB/biopolymer transport protein TolQ
MPLNELVLELSVRSMRRSVNCAHAELKRGISALATIGATAPFVGLFGTVIGIVNCFRGFSGTPTRLLSTTAGGISEALVTTGLGLIVAVPAVWAHNYFTTRLELFDTQMNSSVDAVSAYLAEFQAKQLNR